MQAKDLLVSGVSITEDHYNYKGLFILSYGDKSMSVDLADMESVEKVQEIKSVFELKGSNEEIKGSIMSMVIEKASISSRIKEGEDYIEDKGKKEFERSADSLDMA